MFRSGGHRGDGFLPVNCRPGETFLEGDPIMGHRPGHGHSEPGRPARLSHHRPIRVCDHCHDGRYWLTKTVSIFSLL